jgi:hypothetical protein
MTWTDATVKKKPKAVIEAPTRKSGLSSKEAMSEMNLVFC